MMRRRFFAVIVMILCFTVVRAQQVEEYGVDHNMPVFYEQLKEQLKYPLSYEHCCKDTSTGSAQDSAWTFDQWKANARKAVEKTMQMAPPAPSDYSYEVLGEEQHDGYKTQLIAFDINKWEKVKAYLLVPSSKVPSFKRFPAILILHDHGAHFSIGKEKMVRPLSSDTIAMKDAEEWIKKCYDGVFVGDELAKQGYVVLSTDALLWGDRGIKGNRELGIKGTKEQKQKVYDVQQALASNLLQMGTSWGAWIVWDDIRSAAFLAHLPMVDKDRVGCLGFSMGAYRSWMLAALSDDIKVSASVCWMNDTEHLMTLTNNQNKGGSAYAMLVPGLRNLMDYADVASLACPKPSLFFNGTKDKLFPVDGVNNAYKTLHTVYHSQGVDGNLTTKLWDEKHFFNRQMQKGVLDFFKKEL